MNGYGVYKSNSGEFEHKSTSEPSVSELVAELDSFADSEAELAGVVVTSDEPTLKQLPRISR